MEYGLCSTNGTWNMDCVGLIESMISWLTLYVVSSIISQYCIEYDIMVNSVCSWNMDCVGRIVEWMEHRILIV